MNDQILCAAIWYKDNNIYPHQPKNIQSGFVIVGRRHCNCIMTLAILSDNKELHKSVNNIEGFITKNNLFLNRIEACKLAVESGQISKINASGKLYSEDLY